MVDAAFRIRKRAVRKADPPEIDQVTQEQRHRAAERIVQALREAGYSCELVHEGPARTLEHEP